jgi:hypothetical protein
MPAPLDLARWNLRSALLLTQITDVDLRQPRSAYLAPSSRDRFENAGTSVEMSTRSTRPFASVWNLTLDVSNGFR